MSEALVNYYGLTRFTDFILQLYILRYIYSCKMQAGVSSVRQTRELVTKKRIDRENSLPRNREVNPAGTRRTL